MKPLHIARPVIVEGKYDKQKLSMIMDGNIITTDGFGIFNKKEKLALIRRLAAEKGVICLRTATAPAALSEATLRPRCLREALLKYIFQRSRVRKNAKKQPPRRALSASRG